MALNRLVKTGKIDRVGHGVYVVPKISSRIGKVPPSLEEIALAIAERDHAKILPAGPFALNKLGLSTQVPLKLVYITNGAPRNVKIGKRTIKFKPVAPRNFAYKGKISGLVAQALKDVGEKNVTTEMRLHVVKHLHKEKAEVIKHDAGVAPYWIAKIFYSSLKDKNNEMADINR